MIRRVRRVVVQSRQSPPTPPRGSKPRAYLGIDQSLRGTGMAAVGDDGKVIWAHGWTDKKTLQQRYPERLSWYKMGESTNADRIRRIHVISAWIETQIVWWCRNYDLYVALEGYAFAQASQRASDLHELGGQIKLSVFHQMTVPLRIYDPTTLKASWTGSGTADKSLMIMTCYKKFNEDFTPLESAGENLADATLLAQLLRCEVELKDGKVELKDLPSSIRKVMLRTTKREPEALVSRPFITNDASKIVEPIFGSGAHTWWKGD